VMVRRLKEDIREVQGGFPKRDVIRVEVDCLPDDAPELELSKLLDEYRTAREERNATTSKRAQAAAGLLVVGLQQRLLSSTEAFARSLKYGGRQDVNVNSLLEDVGLAGFGGRIVDTLSGGEKRKLSLASVIAAKPEYLLLDEPAAFLDPVSQIELKNTVKNILRNVKGAMVISHDLSFLSDLVDRIIGLRDGKIAFDLPAERFFSYPEYSRIIDLEIDPMIKFRNKLAETGIQLPCNSLNPKTIREVLEVSSNAPNNFA